MNLKDRLVISKQNITANQNGTAEKGNIPEFKNALEVSDIVKSLITNKKNLIFVSNRETDKAIIIKFIKNTVPSAYNTTESFDENLVNSGKINIIKNASIKDIVKVFEAAISGYKQFICLFYINKNNQIKDKLGALIAINYPPLSDKNIITLMSCSDSVIITIENKDDTVIISEIIEMNDSYEINTMYSYDNQEKQQKKKLKKNPEPKEQIIEEKESAAEVIEQPVKKQKIKNILIDEELLNYEASDHIVDNNTPDIIEEEIQNDTADETQISSEPAKKVNKYKLLKEKIKSKQHS